MDEKIIEEVKKAIAENVKEKRISQRITAVNAAKDLGISRSQLYRIENGDALVEVHTLVKMSKYYNISLDQMFGSDDTSSALTVGEKIDDVLEDKSEKTKDLVYQCSKLIAQHCEWR